MMPGAPTAFGFDNGVLPILVMVALTLVLPMPFSRIIGDRQGRLAAVMLSTALDLVLAGAVLLAVLTRIEDPTAALDPLAFVERGLRFGLLWGPVWALVWLVRAQAIERRKGLRMGRGDDNGLS